jgi:hypothetical protein
MEQSKEILGLGLPARRESSPSLQPGEEALDFPASLVAAEFAAILLAEALMVAGTFGRDEVNAAFFGEAAA